MEVPIKNSVAGPRYLHTVVKYEDGALIWGGGNSDETVLLKLHSNIFYLKFCKNFLEVANNFLDKKTPIKNIQKIKNEALGSQIANCLLDKKYSDVVFHVENETFYAHKIILSANCSHFDKMFQSKLKVLFELIFTGKMTDSSINKISIPNTKATTFQGNSLFILIS